MGRGPNFDHAALRAAYEAAPGRSPSGKMRAAAAEMKCSFGTMQRAVKGRGAGAQSASPRGPAPLGENKRATVLPVGHPATMERRALFPTMVFDVGKERLLKEGDNSAKLGRVVTKGAWKGFPIYTLTLEERATCPTSCRHWSSCFGNNTPFARRWRHGPELEWRLVREVAALELDNPAGFAVRLHNLGDFYSVGYVEMWRGLLERHPALHCFGFTARIDTMDDEIAYAVAVLVRDYWTRCDPPRFAVRFSNAPVGTRSTRTLESPVQKPADAVICPMQWTAGGKKAQSCGSCALCWTSTRPVAFLQH
jgi:hypothetical protein